MTLDVDQKDVEQNAKDIRRSAMDLLSRREHAFEELVTKLSRRYSPQDVIEQQVSLLAEQNLQCDERFTESFIRDRISRGKGPRFIRQDLQRKGVSHRLLEQHLDERDPQWFELAEQAYLKKFSGPIIDQKDRAKRIRFMLSRGFTQDTVYPLLDKQSDE